jgi:UPF0755 protein
MRHVRALMLSVAMIALMLSCGGYIILRELRTPASVSDTPVEIEIAPGDSAGRIATRLRTNGLIRQPIFFTALVRYKDLDQNLQAGRYMLRPNMTVSDILIALQNNRVDEVSVTIPEGLRIEEVAGLVAAADLELVDEESFLATARNGAVFKDDYFLLSSLPDDASLEGYLFPDTYRIASTATVTEVVELMLDRFDEQYNSIERDIRVPDVTVHEIVTMASIIQREAALVEEMPQIAAVFWNRLEPENAGETGGGKLQADPTVQYALGYSVAEETWWRKDLTVADLQIDHPYNTRERTGLPPGPISNPGLAALTAAAQPDESAEYLYFVASCAKDGSHNFAATFEEFQRYQSDFQACQ